MPPIIESDIIKGYQLSRQGLLDPTQCSSRCSVNHLLVFQIGHASLHSHSIIKSAIAFAFHDNYSLISRPR